MQVGDLVRYTFDCEPHRYSKGVGIITAVSRDKRAIQPRACDDAVDLYFVRWMKPHYRSGWTHPTRLVVINESR